MRWNFTESSNGFDCSFYVVLGEKHVRSLLSKYIQIFSANGNSLPTLLFRLCLAATKQPSSASRFLIHLARIFFSVLAMFSMRNFQVEAILLKRISRLNSFRFYATELSLLSN